MVTDGGWPRIGALMRMAQITKRLRRLALPATAALALSAAVSGALAKPAYLGIWSTNPALCGRHTPDAIISRAEFTRRGLVLFERICDARSVNGRNGVWSIGYRCETAGEIRREHLTVWATTTRLTIKTSDSPVRDNYARRR